MVPSGAPDQDSWGEMLAPEKPQPLNTCFSGRRLPCWKDVLDASSAGTAGNRE